MYKYNDNELLYLIYENNDIALGILFNKYENLIRKRLYTFKIKKKNYDDFFQECLMTLYLAIKIYNPYSKKTFNKFFDLILQRRIMTLLRAEKKYFYQVSIIDEIITLYEETKYESSDLFYDEDSFNKMTDNEKKIFQLKYINNYSNREIATMLNVDIKYVYNHTYLIKKRLNRRNRTEN